MFQEALEDSWFYKEVIQKGMEQGMQQGIEQGMQRGMERGEMKTLRSMLIRIVKTHFPDLLTLAYEEMEQSPDPAVLNAKIDKLLIAQTIEEAHQALQEN